MKFKILLHPRAANLLEKLDKTLREKAKTKLEKLEEYPEKRGERLRYTDFWKLRIEDYRAIYEIDREKAQVIILFIGHRKTVYDDFSRLF